MPQESQHSRDVLSYRALYVLRRPLSSASPPALLPQRGEWPAVSRGRECPQGEGPIQCCQLRPRWADPGQESELWSHSPQTFSAKGPDGKCFRFCGPYGRCHTELCRPSMEAAADSIMQGDGSVLFQWNFIYTKNR